MGARLDSPLAEPGQEVNEGETIVAINGHALSETLSPGQLLVNTAGREVVLSIARNAASAARS